MTIKMLKILFWVGLLLAARAWYLSTRTQTLVDKCADFDLQACGIEMRLQQECAAGITNSCGAEDLPVYQVPHIE